MPFDIYFQNTTFQSITALHTLQPYSQFRDELQMHQRPDDIWYEQEYKFLQRSKANEVLFQQGLSGIPGSVHALKEVTVSKYQIGFEELEMHGHVVIKIAIQGRTNLQMC